MITLILLIIAFLSVFSVSFIKKSRVIWGPTYFIAILNEASYQKNINYCETILFETTDSLQYGMALGWYSILRNAELENWMIIPEFSRLKNCETHASTPGLYHRMIIGHDVKIGVINRSIFDAKLKICITKLRTSRNKKEIGYFYGIIQGLMGSQNGHEYWWDQLNSVIDNEREFLELLNTLEHKIFYHNYHLIIEINSF